MSQELKPCPFCSGEAEMRVYDGEYFAQCIQCFCSTAADHQQDSDALTAWNRRPSPVPPAGGKVECAICADLGDQCVTCEEAEFAAWADRHFASADYRQTSAGVFIQDWMRHSFAAWQARGKDVTRLQAENAALQQRLTFADQRVDDLESDIAKVRELVRWLYTHANVHEVGTIMMDAARDFIAHQSAPAAKDGE